MAGPHKSFKGPKKMISGTGDSSKPLTCSMNDLVPRTGNFRLGGKEEELGLCQYPLECSDINSKSTDQWRVEKVSLSLYRAV
jgi:hypothetical protein